MTSSPPEPTPTTTPEAPAEPAASSPRPPRRGRSGVPHVSSLFKTPAQGAVQEPGTPGPEPAGADSLLGSGSPQPGSADGTGRGRGRGSRGPSTPSDVPPAPPSPISRKALRQSARDTVQGLSQIASDNLTRDELEAASGLWVASDDHAKLIGDPAANIVARRLSAAGVAGSPDVADALAMLAGLCVYALHQLALRGAIRRHRAKIGPAAAPVYDIPAEQEVQ